MGFTHSPLHALCHVDSCSGHIYATFSLASYVHVPGNNYINPCPDTKWDLQGCYLSLLQ